MCAELWEFINLLSFTAHMLSFTVMTNISEAYKQGEIQACVSNKCSEIRLTHFGCVVLSRQHSQTDFWRPEARGVCCLDLKLIHEFFLQEKVVIGIAYDCVEKMIYWTDISTPAISRANLQGGEPVQLIKSGNRLRSMFL